MDYWGTRDTFRWLKQQKTNIDRTDSTKKLSVILYFI